MTVTMYDIARKAGTSQTTVSLGHERTRGHGGHPGEHQGEDPGGGRGAWLPAERAGALDDHGQEQFFGVPGAQPRHAEYESRTLAGVVEEAERQGFFVKLVFPSPQDRVISPLWRGGSWSNAPPGCCYRGLGRQEAFACRRPRSSTGWASPSPWRATSRAPAGRDQGLPRQRRTAWFAGHGAPA